MITWASRRWFLTGGTLGSASLLLGCGKGAAAQTPPATGASEKSAGAGEPEVTATEDLMREHGVIRRALVVYREAAALLRSNPSGVPSDALTSTAQLLRTFGEDYHEKALEEAHIFPALQARGGPAQRDVGTLIVQHQRGRELNEYVLGLRGANLAAHAEPLAKVLDSFARMYEEHAAIEDTVVFPAWKKTMSPKQLDEIGEMFEEIEHKTFGKDGYEDAVSKIAVIEKAFGLDLARFTPSAPPAMSR